MLPEAPDAVLVEELLVVISSGWKLCERPNAIRRIPHLLQLVDSRATESLRAAAGRLLVMLDEAFSGAAGATEQDEPILTDEQSRGLRILFGTEPDYRKDYVNARRTNAATCLLDRDLEPDSFYRTHERAYARLALECLRRHYGQESSRSARLYQLVSRKLSAVVGLNRRLETVALDMVYKVLRDGIDVFKTSFTVGAVAAPLVEAISISDVYGVRDYLLERRDLGDFRLEFPLERPAAVGDSIAWGYTRRYHYRPGSPPPKRGHAATISRSYGYVASLDVCFSQDIPPVIWQFTGKRTYIPGSPRMDAQLEPDADRRVRLPPTEQTSGDEVYGIAWRWSAADQPE